MSPANSSKWPSASCATKIASGSRSTRPSRCSVPCASTKSTDIASRDAYPISSACRCTSTQRRCRDKISTLIASVRALSRIALLATAALAGAACDDSATVQTALVTRRSLVVPILADGTLEPPPGSEVRAPEGGVVGAIFAHEGQRVSRGSALLRLDNPDLSQRVLASRAESAQLAAEAAAAQRERDHLRAISDANARLVKSRAISAFEYEQSVEKARQ